MTSFMDFLTALVKDKHNSLSQVHRQINKRIASVLLERSRSTSHQWSIAPHMTTIVVCFKEIWRESMPIAKQYSGANREFDARFREEATDVVKSQSSIVLTNREFDACFQEEATRFCEVTKRDSTHFSNHHDRFIEYKPSFLRCQLLNREFNVDVVKLQSSIEPISPIIEYNPSFLRHQQRIWRPFLGTGNTMLWSHKARSSSFLPSSSTIGAFSDNRELDARF